MSFRVFTMAAVLIIVTIQPRLAGSRKVKTKNYNLDVVFLLDQSFSMPSTNYKEVINRVGEWVQSFLDTQNTENAQFAVVGCNAETQISWPPGGRINPTKDSNMPQPKMYYNFTTKIVKDDLLKALNDTYKTTNPNDWLDECVFYAVNKTLTEEFGHRPNATVVAIFITDCDFYENNLTDAWNESHRRAAEELMVKKNATFFFFCSLDNGAHKFNYKGDQHNRWECIMNWLKVGKQDRNESVILYKNDIDLDKALSVVIPSDFIEIIDCQYEENKGGCQIHPLTGQCQKPVNVTITQYPLSLPKGLSLANPEDKPRACPTKLHKWSTDDCKPENCSNAKHNLVDAATKTNVVSIVLPVVGGLIGLITFLVAVAIMVYSRRKKKRQMARGIGQERKFKNEKNKGIAAELQSRLVYAKGQNSPTMGSSSKGRKAVKTVEIVRSEKSVRLKKEASAKSKMKTSTMKPKMETSMKSKKNPSMESVKESIKKVKSKKEGSTKSAKEGLTMAKSKK